MLVLQAPQPPGHLKILPLPVGHPFIIGQAQGLIPGLPRRLQIISQPLDILKEQTNIVLFGQSSRSNHPGRARQRLPLDERINQGGQSLPINPSRDTLTEKHHLRTLGATNLIFR